MVGTVRHVFGFFAGEGGIVQDLAFPAGDETRVAVNAGDEPVTVSGYGKARIGPEFCGRASRWDLRGTFEAHDG